MICCPLVNHSLRDNTKLYKAVKFAWRRCCFRWRFDKDISCLMVLISAPVVCEKSHMRYLISSLIMYNYWPSYLPSGGSKLCNLPVSTWPCPRVRALVFIAEGFSPPQCRLALSHRCFRHAPRTRWAMKGRFSDFLHEGASSRTSWLKVTMSRYTVGKVLDCAS